MNSNIEVSEIVFFNSLGTLINCEGHGWECDCDDIGIPNCCDCDDYCCDSECDER